MRRRRGFLLLEVMVFLFLFPVLVYVGVQIVTVITKSFEIERVNETRMKVNALVKSLSDLAVDIDNDGYPEPLNFSNTSTDPQLPPQVSGYYFRDGWGTPFRYCPYDNGPVNSVNSQYATRNNGLPVSYSCQFNSTIDNTCIAFILISAGRNRIFDTTCSNAYSGNVYKDDLVYVVKIGSLR